MDIRKMKELNERILEKAAGEIEKHLVTNMWDNTTFEAFSDAIVSLYKLDKMEEKEHREYESKERKSKIHKEKKSEFEDYFYRIIDEGKYDIYDIMVVFNDHMEDIKILQPKFYNKVMMKLKEMCK